MPDDKIEETTEQGSQAITEQAAVTSEQAAQQTSETQATQVASAETVAQPSLFQGKYKSPEEGFWHQKGIADALQTRPAETKSAQPQTYTPEQLWTLKQQKLTEMVAAQVAGEADKASTAAAQVNWIDNQLLDQRLSAESRKWQGQSTMQQLVSEGAELLKPYQAELVPGNPLNEEAANIFGRGQMAFEAETGQPMTNTQKQLLSAYSVLAAAAKTGKSTAGVAQQARQEFAGAMKDALKQAVITGAGNVAKTTDKTPDFMAMDDKEFMAYERKIGVRT